MPKVSVVVPVFNGEKYIAAAIESVLDQNYKDFEIIVVDDGSTDATEKIVRQFSGSLSYHRQENRGAGTARNLGVSLAQGDWIAFLDADDVWYPHKLAVQMENIETYPEVAFFYSDMDQIDEEGRLGQQRFLSAKLDYRKGSRLIAVLFNNQPFPYPSTVLLRKDVFLEAGGFNPLFRGKYLEDLEFPARVKRISSMYFFPKSLVKYRVYNSHRTTDTSGWEWNWPILWGCLSEIYKDRPEMEPVLKAFLTDYARHFTRQGKHYLREGNYEAARRYFRLAYSIQPFSGKNLRRLALSYLPGIREFYIYHKRGI